MSSPIERFLAGDTPHHVAAYFADDTLSDPETLAEQPYAEAVDAGVRIVVPGEAGRSAFESATGIDPMDFAGQAMGTEGTVGPNLADGVCPEADEAEDQDHDVTIVFAFAEEQNEDVDGLYAEGDVIHAYAQCACGTAYSDKWLAEGQ